MKKVQKERWKLKKTTKHEYLNEYLRSTPRNKKKLKKTSKT